MVAEAAQERDLPTTVKDQLSATRENLNKHMGETLQLVAYKAIDNPHDLATKIAMTAMPTSTVAHGNIVDPKTVHMGTMKAITGSYLQDGAKLLKKYAVEAIHPDDLSVELTWVFKGQTFKTVAFYNDKGITWDNVMIGLIMMETEPVITRSEEAAKARSKWVQSTWTGSWIWGSERGSMHYRLTITYEGSNVINTTMTDGAWMNLGSARSESKVTHRTGRFGEGQYALGLATPLASLSFSYNNFTVSVSGVGSSLVRNGTRDLWP